MKMWWICLISTFITFCSADLHTPAEAPNFSSIPQYHLPMLNDLARNLAYKLGIQKAVVANETIVLDVGAGTGLLSLYAASANAKQVIAIEHNAMLSGIGKVIVSDNHFDDRIAFYQMDSREVEYTLPHEACVKLQAQTSHSRDCHNVQRVDLIITELFDSWIIGEFIMTTLGDLYERRVIDTETRVVPSKGNLFIQLVQCAYSFPSINPPTISGYNYSAYSRYNLYTFNEMVASPVDITKHLSSVVNAFNFSFEPLARVQEMEEDISQSHDNFINPYYLDRYQRVLFQVNESAVTHGLLFWFNLWMDPEQTIKLSNEPYVTNSHWRQMFLPFKSDFLVHKGTFLSVQIVQLPTRYVVLSNHGRHRLLKIVSLCNADENVGIEVYARYKLRDAESGSESGLGSGVLDESLDINCFIDVDSPLRRKSDCPMARLHQRRLEAESRRRAARGGKYISSRLIGEDIAEEELIFSMDGSYGEYNYWKGYMGQEFVAVIKLPTHDKVGRYSTTRQSFTLPKDDYRYDATCRTEESCGSGSVQLATFPIFCPRPDPETPDL